MDVVRDSRKPQRILNRRYKESFVAGEQHRFSGLQARYKRARLLIGWWECVGFQEASDAICKEPLGLRLG